MCGIWARFSKIHNCPIKGIYELFNLIKHRGPDSSYFLSLYDDTVQLGFHRLAIIDTSSNGDQPFKFTDQDNDREVYILVNGEIYNYKEIINKYDLSQYVSSNSDCEVVKLLYQHYGIETLKKEIINSEFSLCILDHNTKTKISTIHLLNDPVSVRPLYILENEYEYIISSELVGLRANCEFVEKLIHIPGGSHVFISINLQDEKYEYSYSKYHDYGSVEERIRADTSTILNEIYTCLDKQVKKMCMSDRPIGALLSGGFDSSSIVGLASKYLKKMGKPPLKTFSIGLPNSTDEKYAKQVADFCGTEHTHIICEPNELLNNIREVIFKIGTYDTTTIRASVVQYTIGKWISENTDIKVLLAGDGSDEVTSGYMDFLLAPNPQESHNLNIKRLNEIHMYDGLRADRGISTNGLEIRLPYLINEFVEMYLSIDKRYRCVEKCGGFQEVTCEKWLLRKAFDGKNIIPQDVVWRKKEAQSDGCSSKEKSWYKIIEEYVETQIIKPVPPTLDFIKPRTDEERYYLGVFYKIYGEQFLNIITERWSMQFCKYTNPSARVMDIY